VLLKHRSLDLMLRTVHNSEIGEVADCEEFAGKEEMSETYPAVMSSNPFVPVSLGR